MAKGTQISAVISKDTKERLDRLVRETGVKKGFVLEMALRHHLQALAELPREFLIPPRIVVSRQTAEEIARRIADPPAPTPALRKLMRGDGD